MKYWTLVLFVASGFLQQPPKMPQDKEAGRVDASQIANQKSAAQTKDTPTVPTAPSPDSRNMPVTSSNPAEPAHLDTHAPAASNQADDEALNLQRKLALFTGALVFVGALQAGVLIWQACVFGKTLRAINHQAHEMKRQRILTRGQLVTMKGQLEQMMSAGRQTDQMIEQASKQVNAAEGQVRLMEKAGTHTEGLAQQAVRQTELTQKELELAHRPWIAVDIGPDSPLIFDERGCVMILKVTMRNVGHSVAKHVSLWTEFAIAGIHDPMQVRDKLCNIMKRPENENSDYGLLLFPNQQAVEQRPVIGSLADVQKATEMKVFQGLNAIGLHLVGCVDYPSAFDPRKHHQTRFVYLVGHVDTTRGVVKGAFDPTVKMHYNIVLSPTGHGASAD